MGEKLVKKLILPRDKERLVKLLTSMTEVEFNEKFSSAENLDRLTYRCWTLLKEEEFNKLIDENEKLSFIRDNFVKLKYKRLFRSIFDPTSDALPTLYRYEDLKVKVDDVLNTLEPREEVVVHERYGITKDGVFHYPKNLEKVAKEISLKNGIEVSRERIRQIEAKALRKLRNPVRSQRLRMYLFTDDKAASMKEDIQRQKEIMLNSEKLLNDLKESKSVNTDLINIKALDISVRAYNCLMRAGKRTLSDLLKMTDEDFMRVRNLGRQSADEVLEKLAEIVSSMKSAEISDDNN